MTLPFFDPRLIDDTENKNQAAPPAKVAKAAKAQENRGVSPLKFPLKSAKVENAEPALANFSTNFSSETPQKPCTLAALATLAAPSPGKRILAALPILLAGRPDRELTAARQAVTAFMDNHLEEARCIGWTDLELFGCYPVREAARNRYDYAGAVTLAAMSGHSIEQMTVRAAHYENGLAYYRRPMPADGVPVWELGKTQSQVQSG